MCQLNSKYKCHNWKLGCVSIRSIIQLSSLCLLGHIASIFCIFILNSAQSMNKTDLQSFEITIFLRQQNLRALFLISVFRGQKRKDFVDWKNIQNTENRNSKLEWLRREEWRRRWKLRTKLDGMVKENLLLLSL